MALSSFDEVKKAVFAEIGETAEARKILLACDETLTNIVSYSGASELTYCCTKEGDTLRIGFRDNGTAFDPTAPRAMETDFDMLDMGGMGIGIVRETASSMEYARRDDRNVLFLCFRL